MFVPTFYRLTTIGWKSADFTHAYFILPVTVWLIWRKRGELKPSAGGTASGIALFIVGLLAYVYAGLNDFMFLDAFSFVLVTWGVFRIRFTRDSCRAILFPLAYLLFLVPPPGLVIDAMTYPLKQISTAGSYLILKLFQTPVLWYGAILRVGDHEMFMADACSGFRSITTLLALGAVYAYMQKASNRAKWMIFLSILPLGVLGNILRITLTGLLSYHINPKYAEGFFHDFSGYVLFLVTIGGLVWVTDFVVKREARA